MSAYEHPTLITLSHFPGLKRSACQVHVCGRCINAVQASPDLDLILCLRQALRPTDRGVIARLRTGINERSAAFFYNSNFVIVQGNLPSVTPD
jgi:hypothetical protein